MFGRGKVSQKLARPCEPKRVQETMPCLVCQKTLEFGGADVIEFLPETSSRAPNTRRVLTLEFVWRQGQPEIGKAMHAKEDIGNYAMPWSLGG